MTTSPEATEEQKHINLIEQLRKTNVGKYTYSRRKETIEIAFADAMGKHNIRYTHHRGLARVTTWVRLKFAVMKLKKLTKWCWDNPDLLCAIELFLTIYVKTPAPAY